MKRQRDWVQFELQLMQIVYPYFPTPLVAKGLDRTDASVSLKGADMGLKKTARARSAANGNKLRTHCVNGHAFTQQNTRHHMGRRTCRTCVREYSFKQRLRRTA